MHCLVVRCNLHLGVVFTIQYSWFFMQFSVFDHWSDLYQYWPTLLPLYSRDHRHLDTATNAWSWNVTNLFYSHLWRQAPSTTLRLQLQRRRHPRVDDPRDDGDSSCTSRSRSRIPCLIVPGHRRVILSHDLTGRLPRVRVHWAFPPPAPIADRCYALIKCNRSSSISPQFGGPDRWQITHRWPKLGLGSFLLYRCCF